MEQQKPFLNQNYSIHDLSRDVEIPVYQLSPIINNYFQTNFNGWINKYRVNYFIQISEGDGKMGLTLDAIAKESGFTNRTTFTNAFKKEKGTTPGQFIKTRQTSF
jgi:AraC-like DNA-binding protein